MSDPEELDLSLKSYEEWVSFLFERSVPKEMQDDPFAGEDITPYPEQPLVLVEYLTRLCHDLPNMVTTYDWPLINQGLWGALMYPSEIGIVHLWNRQLPLAPRIECVRAMESIYPNVVAKIPPDIPRENIFDAWWDIVCSAYEYGERDDISEEGRISEDALANPNGPLLVAVFETLKNILALDDQCCQTYALHGLGHCPHPGSGAVVQGFIDKNREMIEKDFPDFMKWLEQCRDGTVM